MKSKNRETLHMNFLDYAVPTEHNRPSVVKQCYMCCGNTPCEQCIYMFGRLYYCTIVKTIVMVRYAVLWYILMHLLQMQNYAMHYVTMTVFGKLAPTQHQFFPLRIRRVCGYLQCRISLSLWKKMLKVRTEYTATAGEIVPKQTCFVVRQLLFYAQVRE